MNDCIFCKIVKGEIPCNKVYENKQILAFLDIHPTNKGHTLIIPKEHYADLTETPDNILSELSKTIKEIGPKIVDAVNANGFNVISNVKAAAGQVIFHTHVHIIPRFEGDGFSNAAEVAVFPF